MILTRKLLAPAVVLLALLLGGLFAYFYSSLHDASHESEEESLQSLGRAFNAVIANQQELALSLAVQGASLPSIQEALAQGNENELAQAAQASFAGLDTVEHQFYLPNGTLLHSADASTSGSPQDAVVAFVNLENTLASGLEVKASGLIIVGVAPVHYRGTYVGCIEIGIPLDNTLLGRIKNDLGGDWRVLLIDDPIIEEAAGYQHLANTNLLLLGSTQGTDVIAGPENYAAAQTGGESTIHPTVAGNSYAINSSPIRDFSGNIVGVLDIVYNHTHLTSSQNNRLLLAGLVSLGILTLGVIALAAITRRTLTPIQALTRAAGEITDGQSAAYVNIDPQDDEIGVLIRTFNRMTAQLRGSIANLEERIGDRTRELEQQSARLRVATEISQIHTSEDDLNKILERAGQLLVDRFEFLFVGIFLLEKDGAHALLVSSPTKAGKNRIQQKFRLPMDDESPIGYVAKTGEPRIAPDARYASTQFSDSFLPDSRSEIVLPLKSGNKPIGVLDIHTGGETSFQQSDLAVMQIIADQLATAIERARLAEESKRYVSDIEVAYGKHTRDGWRKFITARQLQSLGYRFDNIRIQPSESVPIIGQEALVKGSTVSTTGASANQEVAIPIRFRGQTIGVVHAKLRDGSGETIITTLEQAIDRLASSLETARLYEEAQLKANREQAISQIASLIGSSSDYETILRTTVREIGNVLTDTDVIVQLNSPEDDE
jgi:GAF domain-containing protein/HAMP domain-containing protein